METPTEPQKVGLLSKVDSALIIASVAALSLVVGRQYMQGYFRFFGLDVDSIDVATESHVLPAVLVFLSNFIIVFVMKARFAKLTSKPHELRLLAWSVALLAGMSALGARLTDEPGTGRPVFILVMGGSFSAIGLGFWTLGRLLKSAHRGLLLTVVVALVAAEWSIAVTAGRLVAVKLLDRSNIRVRFYGVGESMPKDVELIPLLHRGDTWYAILKGKTPGFSVVAVPVSRIESVRFHRVEAPSK